MRNYTIYRIACTIELLFFFFFSIMAIFPYSNSFYGENQCYAAMSADPVSVFTTPDGTAQACSIVNGAMTLPFNSTAMPGYFCNCDNAHMSSFYIPVLALVIITILNDGTIISIAYDKVIPEKRPQYWDLRELTIVSAGQGLTACIGSIILLILVMQANYINYATGNGTWVGRLLGSSGRKYITYGEANTMLFLKVGISDYLTVFSSRTRNWFWERRPGRVLGAACVVATVGNTLLSLWWPFSDGGTADYAAVAQMSGLSHSPYAVLMVWIFSILNFAGQDVAKVVTYEVLRRVKFENEETRTIKRMQGLIGAQAHDYDRATRRAQKYSRELSREGSMVGAGSGSGAGKSISADDARALIARLVALEKEVASLKAGGAGAGGAAAAAAPRHGGH
jgi:H+-transporting ATPase